MTTLWFDTETFSSVPLKRGTHAYFEAPDAAIMIAAWALDDGPVIVEDLVEIGRAGDVLPQRPSPELLHHLATADELVMHQSAFDRTGVRHCWGIDLGVERIHDTMVQAMAHSLPGGIAPIGAILGIPEEEAKDEEGKELIQLFCKPRPKNQKLRRATKATHPDEWRRFKSYAGSDIRAMRWLRGKLPKWNYRNTNTHRELDLWRLDQKINDRGFQVDVDLAHKAIDTIAREQKALAAKTKELTNGEVEKATKRDDLLIHVFTEYGIFLPDLKKDTLERRLDDPELPDALRQLLRVRLATSTTSTAKFTALKNSVSKDGRLRGTTQFAGALRTARWSGRLFQPQNLMRPDMSPAQIAEAIEALSADCLDLVTDDVMRALANILRGLIIAKPGHKIVAADLSNIEGRVGPWLAGEQWKLDAFAEIDAAKAAGRVVADMYQRAYGEMFGVDPLTVKGDPRQVGKVSELANGYEGGVGAALAFAAVYRLNLDRLAEEAYPRLPSAARDQAEIMWDWRGSKSITTFGLSRRTFVVFEAFKILWRQAHPATVAYWDQLQEAAKEAIRSPGQEVVARKLAFEKRGAWLRMILPSGRALCYPAPRVETRAGKEQITYMGVNAVTRQWQRISTYGGKLFENADQATARDVMAANMPEIEDSGFPIILTVHDEVITEPPGEIGQGPFTSKWLSAILAKNPYWLAGCPLAASGFEAERYGKD